MPKEVIDYKALLERHPWLVEQGQDCVLSPDSDGLLCGLFMSHHFNWKIRGFYDCKHLILEKGFKPSDCVFLDMEIFRPNVRSIGQHMLMFNTKKLPSNWNNFDNAISPNNLRGFDFKNRFAEKYPFGTIHLLMQIAWASGKELKVSDEAICPLLYTDGTFKNIFNYPDNALSWLEYLRADEGMPLHTIFCNEHYTISSMMRALKDLFQEFRVIAGGKKKGGDKIQFTTSKGVLINFDKNTCSFDPAMLSRINVLLNLLANKTGWKYEPKNWTFKNQDCYAFKKQILIPSLGRHTKLVESNPISFALTGTRKLEATLDPAGIFN